MGSGSPVEIACAEERVWEVEGKDVNVRSERGRKGKSLIFDYGVGVWMPKR